MPFDAGDGDDRHRAERDRELDHPRLEDEPECEQQRVAPDRAHAAIRARSPARTPLRRRVTGCRTCVAAERGVRDAADGDHAPAAGELVGEDAAGGDLAARRRRGSTIAVPGWVGTTFQRSTRSARPSSASTRCTIVAVASAGPVPVSWRSDVNGMPEMRAPR